MLDPILEPMMDGPSVRADECVVCGRTHPLEQHHPVRRGAGRVIRDGREVPKPTLTLCGRGNVLSDGGRPYCHGMAHHQMLHFRYTGRWEFLRTREPMKYATALEMEGWRPIRGWERA